MSAKIRLLAAGLAAVLTGAQVCLATIINVPGDQPTIQAEIDAAVDGDTLTLRGIPCEKLRESMAETRLLDHS